MKILCLYNNNCALELFQWLESKGHEVVLFNEELRLEWCEEQLFDFAISYTYRFILSESVIKALNYNVVNIHNSLLPFNRGADPNLWSIIDGTPRGVTLHYIDANLDKGFVIAQELVCDDDNETLYSSYQNLDNAAKNMFKKAFNYYPYWKNMKKQCVGKGSYHSIKDGRVIKEIIDTYSMPIYEFRRKLNGINIHRQEK